MCFWNISGISNLYILDNKSVHKFSKGDITCFCETYSYITYSYTKKDKQRGWVSGDIMLLF